MPKLSDRLKYIRQVKGLSQAELAEKAGTTQQAIQQAEAGQARRPRYLHALAHELDISVEWMALGHAQEEGDEALSSKNEKQKSGFGEKESEVLDSFFAMPKKDQELFFEMMKMRQQQNKAEGNES